MANLQPDGPIGIPLIGPVRELTVDPLGFLTRVARDYGDVVRFREGPFRRVLLLSHPDHIEHMLVREHRKLHKDRITRLLKRSLGDGLLTSEGEHWRRQRRMSAPSFTRAQIALYGDQMVQRTAGAIDSWEHDEVRDVHRDMMSLTLQIVMDTLFADTADPGLTQTVTDALEVILTEFDIDVHTWRLLLPQWVPTAGRRRTDRATQTLHTVLGEIIASGRSRPEPGFDLLSRLIAARDEDDGSTMSDEQLRDELLTTFVAGHETTALALFYTLHLLSQHPEEDGAAREEVDRVLGSRLATVDDMPDLIRVRAIISESMRLYPPAWIIGREAIAPLELGGVSIEKGDQVLASQWVVHRDPRWFTAPEEFQPSRWIKEVQRPRFSYFPFGGGPRVCIGNHFAMMELVLVVATLLQRARHIPIEDGTPTLTPSVTLRPTSHIQMKVQLRDTTWVSG